MGRLLGLKKVESYWLVHKEWFQTITVHGRMRVVIDSFETWYNGQTHYQKTEGPPPGNGFMTIRQMAKLIGVADSTAAWIIEKNHLPSENYDGKLCIKRTEFERWYQSQGRYVKVTEHKRSDACRSECEDDLPSEKELAMEAIVRKRLEKLQAQRSGKERDNHGFDH